MQKILDIINSKDEELRRKWRRILLYTLATAGFFLLFIILGQGMIKANIESWVNSTHPDRAQAAMQYRNYNGPTQLAEMAMISIYRSMIMLKFTLATIWLSLFRRMPKFLPGLVIAILLLVDLGSMTDKLIHPKSLNIIERAFVSDPVSEKLSGDINSRAKVFGIMEMYSIIEGTMRMGQIDGATANQMLAQVQQNLRGMRAVNVWGAEGVQIQEGYTGSKPSWYGYLEEKRALSHPTIMAVTGVNYLIAPGEIPGSVPVAGKSGGYGGLLYKNPNTLPMAYLRSRWVVIDDLQTTLDTLLTPGYDYTRNLILNKEPQGVTKDTAVTGEAKLVERIGNTAKIEVQSDKAAILVFADSYSSAGWKAFVNGTETEILRANGITRAIAVPAGSSTIEFIYKPAHWGISLLITIIAWACIIGLFVWGLLVHLKNRGDISDPVAI